MPCLLANMSSELWTQAMLERAERAATSYAACLDVCIEDNLNRLCRAGKVEEAEELRSVLSDCAQLVEQQEEQCMLRGTEVRS